MELKFYPHLYFEILIIGFSLMVGVGLSKAFLPIMAYELNPTGTMVGFVTSAWFFARAFVEIPSGLMAIKIGRRTLIICGLLLSIFGSLLCIFSSNIHMLLLGIAIWGFGSSFVFTCNISLILDLFKPEKRGKAIGIFQSIEFVGSFLSAPIGAILAVFIGFNYTFILASIFLLIAFLISLLSRDLKIVDIKAQNEFRTLTLKETLVSLKSWRLSAVSFIDLSRMLITQGIMSTVFQLYANFQLGISVELMGLVMGAWTAGLICGILISGNLSNRVESRSLIISGLLMGGICLYLYTLMTSFEEVMILVTLDGIGSGFVFNSVIIFLSELISPSIYSGAVGVYRTFKDIGGIFGPIFFTFLYTRVNVYTPFWIASLLFFSNMGIVLLIKRR